MVRPLAIIIDCNAVCHAAKYATRKMMLRGSTTSIIYGFMQRLASWMEQTEPDTVVFAWDAPTNKDNRREIFSGYKDRPKSTDEREVWIDDVAFPQFETIKTEILPHLGFENIFELHGLEADDTIASITMNNSGFRFVIFSSDHDLFQLITPNCSMYDIGRKILIDEDDFIVRYGITPDQWSSVKAIAGCASDSVPGIGNVGEKTAISYLLGKLDENNFRHKLIEANEDIVMRNFKLVALPFEGTPTITIKNGIQVELKDFMDFCNKYRMNSFMKGKGLERWRTVLHM